MNTLETAQRILKACVLNEREAQCPYCKTVRPSVNYEQLAFFEYRGEGSDHALMYGAHEYDSYYCGCWGWD